MNKNNIRRLKPPRRFLIEIDTDDDGIEFAKLEECTGTEDPIYIVGMESPWLGVSLDEVEQNARDRYYGIHSHEILAECQMIREKDKK